MFSLLRADKSEIQRRCPCGAFPFAILHLLPNSLILVLPRHPNPLRRSHKLSSATFGNQLSRKRNKRIALNEIPSVFFNLSIFHSISLPNARIFHPNSPAKRFRFRTRSHLAHRPNRGFTPLSIKLKSTFRAATEEKN